MMKKTTIFLALLFLGINLIQGSSAQHTFTLGDNAFLLDGKPFQIISGELHYTRIPRAAWRSRMEMAKAMGLNTISTYVFWNEQEPEPGHFDFTGNRDIAAFVRMAQQEGLWVIIRPSPYVCAEWEFGGYPYWLQNIPGLVVRSREPHYMQAYKSYIKAVGEQLAPLQINHGGNILMVQVENEYGSYSNDTTYLGMNRDLFREAGFDGILYTCDPANAMQAGHLPGLLSAVNGLDDPHKAKQLIRSVNNGKGPYFISEWYPGWFDWWGAPHHTVSASACAARLNAVLAAGISINMYMFHGGTTRGFMNGANYNDHLPYEPEISSYDYDAPLDEAGNPTKKYDLFRSVIQKYLPKGETLPPVPASKKAIATPWVRFTAAEDLMNALPVPVTNRSPLTFEQLHQAYGFVLYRTTMNGGRKGMLKIDQLRDYALLFINGKKIGTLDRRLGQDSMEVILPKGKVRMDILVENLGRINFGPYLLHNHKGITHQVLFQGKELIDWKMYRLPFSSEPIIQATRQSLAPGQPVLREGTLMLSRIGDTYLDMQTWGKGCIWINGHNLGRYWSVGPQQTVYVPVEWLHKGANRIEVLELNKPEQTRLRGVDHPILNKLQ
ncbi:glycoside hydrolase family 35 protein [Microbacter margulisiae]|uniref:Beta-galactosidase n=1 Tax=Microbacter margulisiae TaxID=1350067 RepID=A0A7W5DQS3_9PORP|nr:beta-galactosidase family protein [Microbacter margulisiae]MBB3187362.1 beta-galactosidase [Microbacter margulisiae]